MEESIEELSRFEQKFIIDNEKKNSMNIASIKAIRQYRNLYKKEFFEFNEKEMYESLIKIYTKNLSKATITSYKGQHKQYLRWIEKTYDYKLSFNYKHVIEKVARYAIKNSSIVFIDRNKFYEDMKEIKDIRDAIILCLLFEGVGGDTHNLEIMNLKMSDIEKNNVLSLDNKRKIMIPKNLIELVKEYKITKSLKDTDYLIDELTNKYIDRENSQVLRNTFNKLHRNDKFKKYTPINIKNTGKCFYLNLLELKKGKLSIEDYYLILERYNSAKTGYYNLKLLYEKYKNDELINNDYFLEDFGEVLENIESIEINRNFMKSYYRDTEDDDEFNSIIKQEIETIVDESTLIPEKYREQYIKTRIGQGLFREKLIVKHGNKCAICGISNENLLIASHIKEFCNCIDDEHIDEYNGLLLCANHDKLFDKHYISFDKNGKIIISDKLNTQDYEKLNISKDVVLDKNKFKEEYMKFHREKL